MEDTRSTVLIPVRDEESCVAQVVHGVLSLDRELRVLVVDDGSRDGTAKAAAGAGAEVLSLPAPRGKGEAIRAGLDSACGEFVVTIDGDGQDDPRDIPALLDKACEGYDLVIGSRFLGELNPGAISRVNKLGTDMFTALINLMYGASITDSQAGLRVFRRTFLLGMKLGAREYEIETEMLVKSLRRGGRIVEVPVSRYPRGAGKSRFNRAKHGLFILGTVLLNRWP